MTLPRLLSTLCLAGFAAAASGMDRERLVELTASVLKIEVHRAQGGYSIGSGVVVDADRIVTNCHVTRDADAVYVVRGGARWRAERQQARTDLDLCVLRVPDMQGRPVALGLRDVLAVGDEVVGLGYTGGTGLFISEGQVFRLHRYAGARIVQATSGFSSGASGGGLFDASMRLVGILTFRLRGGEAHYYAVPVAWLVPLLETPDPATESEIHPMGANARPFWQAPASEQPAFLVAAALEQNSQWLPLLSVATDWAGHDTGDAEPLYLRGLALEQLGRLADARAALEQALQIEPDLPQAIHRLGLVLVRQGELDRAASLLDRLRARQPQLAQDLQRELGARCAARPAASVAATVASICTHDST